jgi:hypothetical protein
MSRHRLRGDRRPEETAPTTLEMRIALAHYIERCHERGVIRSYADAATRLGITRARLTQLLDLLMHNAEPSPPSAAQSDSDRALGQRPRTRSKTGFDAIQASAKRSVHATEPTRGQS